MSSFMLINGSATKRGFFIMPIVKNSLLLAEPLISIKLLISIYLILPNYKFSSRAELFIIFFNYD